MLKNLNLQWVCVFVILFLYTACGNEFALLLHKPNTHVPVSSVTIDGGHQTLSPGSSLTVTVLPANATNPSVIWTSADMAVIDTTGTAVGEGITTVTATSVDNPSVTDSAIITVPVTESFLLNQPADTVIGHADFTNGSSGTTAGTFNRPIGILIVTGRLFITDYQNNRIMGYSTLPSFNGADADFVMGQPDFSTGISQPVSASTMGPRGITSDGTRLFVADYDNHRILIFNSIPGADNPGADIVVGQTDMTSAVSATTRSGMLWPLDVAVAGDKMVVTEQGNSRILLYNSIPSSNGADADIVLGQGDFTHGTQNDDDQNGADDGSPTARTLRNPGGIWTDGTRIIAADTGNLRVLIWNTWPVSNFQPADVVVGQPNFFTNTGLAASDSSLFLNFNSDVFVSYTGSLYISDVMNQRVLVYNSIPQVNGAAADSVLGQPDFVTSTGGTDVDDFSSPAGLFIYNATGTLYMADEMNNRILMFNTQ